jgi:hypothetical protein
LRATAETKLDNAKIKGMTLVLDNAKIKGMTLVLDNAKIKETTLVGLSTRCRVLWEPNQSSI